MYLVIVFAAATALHWWLYLNGFYAISWDESARILDACNWLANKFFYSETWLPGYRVLIGSALGLHYDLFLTPRVVTYACGLLVIAGAGWLTHELFRSRPVTWIAIVYCAVFSQRVALSLAPLSSIIFIATIVPSFSLLARSLRRGSKRWLYLSSVGFAIAGMIRVEGWFFAAVAWLGLMVMVKKGRTELAAEDLVATALIVGAFPLVWNLTGIFSGRKLVVLADSGRWSFTTVELIRKNPVVEFLFINAPCLNLVGLLSAIRLCRGRAIARFLAAVGGLALVFVGTALLLVGQVQTGPSWRMTAVWGTLLIPYTAHSVWSLGNLFARPGAGHMVRAAATALLCSASLLHLFQIKADSQWAFPEADRAAGQYIEPLIESRPDKVLIESFNYYYLALMTAAQHPDRFILNSAPLEPDKMSAFVEANNDIDWAQLEMLGVRYLVFRDDDIKHRLEASGKVRVLARFDRWSIYILLLPAQRS